MVAFLVILYVAGGAAVGFALGAPKGQALFGLIVGFLFGPLGWIAAGLSEPTPAEAEARRQLDAAAVARNIAAVWGVAQGGQ